MIVTWTQSFAGVGAVHLVARSGALVWSVRRAGLRVRDLDVDLVRRDDSTDEQLAHEATAVPAAFAAWWERSGRTPAIVGEPHDVATRDYEEIDT